MCTCFLTPGRWRQEVQRFKVILDYLASLEDMKPTFQNKKKNQPLSKHRFQPCLAQPLFRCKTLAKSLLEAKSPYSHSKGHTPASNTPPAVDACKWSSA